MTLSEILCREKSPESRACAGIRKSNYFFHIFGKIPLSRSIKVAKAGGPEVLEFIETALPVPGPADVRINVRAIGINRAESMWRRDVYMEPVAFPAGLGYEAAGIVDAVGPGVTGFAVGDEVNVIPSLSMNQYFTYGEVITMP